MTSDHYLPHSPLRLRLRRWQHAKTPGPLRRVRRLLLLCTRNARGPRITLSLNIDFCRHIRRYLNTRILPWETVVAVLLRTTDPSEPRPAPPGPVTERTEARDVPAELVSSDYFYSLLAWPLDVIICSQ
jgi:hypothetical protein